jgi:uncharacterized protein
MLVTHDNPSQKPSPALPSTDPDVTLVLIVSTLCNLRCRYCYEYPDLANRHRMGLAQLALVFERVAEQHADSAPLHIRFAWQGGEPLLQEPEYYRQALQCQRSIFSASRHRVTNVVQTNLTILDEARIELLRDCFDGVGVSHDVVGDLRVDAGGRSRSASVEANIDRLIQARVPLGGITVLSRQNVHAIEEIYAFWQQRRLPFRLLPMHRGPLPTLGGMALSPSDVQRAFAQCFDLWLTDPGDPRPIAPLSELVEALVRSKRSGSTRRAYDGQRQAALLIINPRGFVGGVNDLLDLSSAYGNVLECSLNSILASAGYAARVAQSAQNVENTCGHCPHYRSACNGHPAAEGGKEFWQKDSSGRPLCLIQRGTLDHIERRLREVGLFDANGLVGTDETERSPA